MNNRIRALLFCSLTALSAPCLSFDSAPTADELILWEIQDWKPNGGYKRLTLWRAGYSEIEVAPLAKLPGNKNPYKPKSGWEMIRERDTIRFVHRNAYTPDEARKLFRKALRAGVRRLRSFKPAKKDGGGTRVVINLDEKRKDILIPYFPGRLKGTTNHKRYLAVSRVLGHFDTDAFEGPGAKPAPKPAAQPKPAAEPATAKDDKPAAKAEAESTTAPEAKPEVTTPPAEPAATE